MLDAWIRDVRWVGNFSGPGIHNCAQSVAGFCRYQSELVHGWMLGHPVSGSGHGTLHARRAVMGQANRQKVQKED